MKVFHRESLICALIFYTVTMTACTNPGYNDNPSQQIANARVGCLASTNFFSVYYSLHVQPSSEIPDAIITKDLFHTYCNDMPAPGKVFLTIDLVGSELRKVPIGIRIVEQDSGDALRQTENADSRTLLEVLPKTYSKGVIESQFELNKNGNYAIYLIRGGEDAASEEDKLIIPVNVGVYSSTTLLMSRIIKISWITLGLALIGFAAFKYVRRRKPGMEPTV